MVALNDTKGMAELAARVLEAKSRGYDRGFADAYEGFKNDSPLSGEWAGESIPELLGDLIDDDDEFEIICEAYESGYEEGQSRG